MKTNTMPAATGTQNGNTGDISILNTTIPEISRSAHTVNVITLRRPRRDAPVALQLPVNSSHSLKRVFCVWHWYFHNFHGLGANSRSCPFLLSLNYHFNHQNCTVLTTDNYENGYFPIQQEKSWFWLKLKNQSNNQEATVPVPSLDPPQRLGLHGSSCLGSTLSSPFAPLKDYSNWGRHSGGYEPMASPRSVWVSR